MEKVINYIIIFIILWFTLKTCTTEKVIVQGSPITETETIIIDTIYETNSITDIELSGIDEVENAIKLNYSCPKTYNRVNAFTKLNGNKQELDVVIQYTMSCDNKFSDIVRVSSYKFDVSGYGHNNKIWFKVLKSY